MKETVKNIIGSIKKYYVSLLLFAFATIGMILLIQNDYDGLPFEEVIAKLVMVLIYGAIVALVIKSIIDRMDKIKYCNLLYFIVPILMMIVYVFMLNDINILSNILKYFILCFLTSLLFLVIPFLNKKEDSDYYSYRVIISLMFTGFCYLLLMFGIFTIMQSVSVLFEIKIQEQIYSEIAIFILGFIMPTIFVSGIPNKELERRDYPNVIKKILIYIIYPILTIYIIVLYSYFIKILVEFELPTNVLGSLIIYYALISIVILYFVNKIKNENKWNDLFVMVYPYTLIVPMFMMLVTFLIRIKQYGFTEPRYYGLLIFIFVILSIFALKEKDKVKYIPITLSILLLISIWGPLSAANVSKSSQENKLEQILNDNNMIVDNKIIKSAAISANDQNEINNIIDYFNDMHSLKDIDLLPNDFEIKDMTEVFGFDRYITF